MKRVRRLKENFKYGYLKTYKKVTLFVIAILVTGLDRADHRLLRVAKALNTIGDKARHPLSVILIYCFSLLGCTFVTDTYNKDRKIDYV